jgi:alpha-muurolene/germacrene-A/gamma-muurolene synthase
LRVVADFLGYLFHLDNISDGMMTKDTDVLADVVMNAHWFPDQYIPCKSIDGKEQPIEEIGAGKLAREYVFSS